ncbi:MAG: hypothetical protein JNJ75_08695 [Cyclobacteriaceae bacterium]|nr:hypothetical protein [Cyclobacteriaceae bacterium]
MSKTTISLLTIVCILCSCATSYKPINPQKLYFSAATVGDSLNYAVRGNVLAEAGNERYAKKEIKNNVRLIGVQVVNKSDHDIVLRKDARFYLGDKVVFPIEPEQLKNQLKQPAGLYMLWSLLWVVVAKCENDDCNVIPIPLGFLIGVGNTSKASKANKALLHELEQNNILDRVIHPGEAVTGLIGVAGSGDTPLRIELSK